MFARLTLPYLLIVVLFFATIQACQSPREVKFRQYFVQGEQLYIKHCSNCHQKEGTGLGLLYPPLNESDFMDENFGRVICLMKNGISGEITVNGKTFNQPMPGVPTLTDLELAEIATFIYNNWGQERGLIEIDQITNSLAACAD